MMTIGFLQQSGTTMNISWLVWVILTIFVLMVFLGWWASGRIPKEDEAVSLEGGDHGGHVEAVADHEPQAVAAAQSAEVVSQEERVAERPEAGAEEADNLVSLEGIGPKTASLLSGMGITTFAALAAADPGKIREALVAAGYGFMDPAGWIEQAKLAATGDKAGLKKLQEALKGGRRAG